MNKTQFTSIVAAKIGTTQKDAAAAVDAVLATVIEVVSVGDKLSLPGFGNFEHAVREARTMRNPRTGEPVEIGTTYTPKFRPGQVFKDRVTEGLNDTE